MDYKSTLAEYGLTEEQYEDCIKDIQDKVNGLSDMDWQDIVNRYNLPMTNDTLRKACSSMPFGSKFVLDYFSTKNVEKTDDFDEKIAVLKEERYKIQALNLEKSRLDRENSRHTLFFEYVRDVIKQIEPPTFAPIITELDKENKEYVLCLADIHYGAAFKTINNEYSPEIAYKRFEKLLSEVESFIREHSIKCLKVISLGDDVQGLLRMTDIRLNDSSVVKAVVEVSHLIAEFLNSLSRYVNIEYYHVPTSNHSQNRNLGTKASELPWEDMEYIIGHYIKDLLVQNNRIKINLANDNEEIIKVPIFNLNIVAMHGHQFRDASAAIKQMSLLRREFIDTLIIGHQHSSKELVGYETANSDAEVLVCPSFIGSDPYADKLMVGAKPAVKIFGFDEKYGHTETYKIIL